MRRTIAIAAPWVGLAAACVGLGGCGSGPEQPAATTPTPTVTSQAPLHRATEPTPVVPEGETLGAAVLRPTTLPDSAGGRVLSRLSTHTGFGSRRVLAVVSPPGAWLEVLSATLKNGRTGWVRRNDVRLLRETWSIEIDLSRRQLTLRHKGAVHTRMQVAVGAPGTTTPRGRFAVTDRLRTGSARSPYGCCILALNGRQPNIAQDWPGGDRIAIHGTSDPDSIGGAISHGCVRADADDIRLLMARVPLGTQVRIRA